MLKQFLVLAIVFLNLHNLYACDSCSGISSSSLDGQLLPSNKSFFGLNTSFLHQLNGKKEKVNNVTYGLFGAYSFAKKWQVFVSLPIHHRIIIANDNSEAQFGLGDASLMMSYNVYVTPSEKASFSKSKLILRGGVKFPTGYYNIENDINSNLGSNSFDFLLGVQYIFEKNSQGLNTSLNAKINTGNNHDFRYGNKFDFNAFYYVKRTAKTISYMPYLGLQAEFLGKDLSNNFVRNLSGGDAYYGFGGFMMNFNSKFSIITRGELPIYQNYKTADGLIYNNIKAQIQLTFYIKNKEKISKTIKLKINENN